MKRGKKYREALKLIEPGRVYTFEEAIPLLKKTSVTKFDSTIDISFRLNVNPTLADQLVRGTLVLPHGNGKTKKVLVVTGTKEEEARKAGADYVGGKEMLEKIQRENWFGFDVIVATPDMMGELGKMGRLLGPKGLMPNPKTGTVTMDVKGAVIDIKKGKIAYRVDRDGNLSMPIAKVSFSDADLLDNLTAVVDRNMLQITGCTEDVIRLESLADKYRAFGWSVEEIDGNDMKSVVTALDRLPFERGKPSLILAHTVKGKGVSFAENQAKWHHGIPNEAQYREAMAALEAKRRETAA